MAAENDGQERTEQPTPKRLQEAKEKGEIARSRELTTLAVLLAAGAGVLMFGPSVVGALVEVLHLGMAPTRETVFDPALQVLVLREAMLTALLALTPFFGVVIAAAFLAPMALGGWSFSTKSLAFKGEKLDPVKGIKRIFSARALMEFGKALAKFLVIGIVALLVLYAQSGTLLGLGAQDLEPALSGTAQLLAWSFVLICASLILIASVDVPFQLWDHTRKQKMTRQEVKDELKQTDGSPEVKGRIRGLQREMARRRMMDEVPKADVVVTNPTHYAVALRYDQKNMRAPVVVAKGSNLVAARIRGIAAEHDVALVSAPPLTRALYYSTEIGEPVPAGLYVAVAQVLAYVYQLREGRSVQPPAAGELPIPDELRRDAPPDQGT